MNESVRKWLLPETIIDCVMSLRQWWRKRRRRKELRISAQTAENVRKIMGWEPPWRQDWEDVKRYWIEDKVLMAEQIDAALKGEV